MKRQKTYQNAVFSPIVIRKALELAGKLVEEKLKVSQLHINHGDDRWDYDDESEFFSDYREPFEYATLNSRTQAINVWFECYGVRCGSVCTEVAVTHSERSVVQSIIEVFDDNLHEALVSDIDKEIPRNPPTASRPTIIFIGHGRSPQWVELKDHLHDLHGYQVEAYETGARSGHTIRDVLDNCLQRSSFAILVHTAEDKLADGTYQARPNVIHETGLFQGKLGFSRVAILLEEGTADYSNLQGIHQIRYKAGNIRETFGDVLATLRREFGPNFVST